MDIGLLSLSMQVYSTNRIAEEAEKRGHYIEHIDYTKCNVRIGKRTPQIIYKGEDIIDEFDVVVPRIGVKYTKHGSAIVKQFEANNVFSTARSLSILRARDKVLTLQIMTQKGIPVPETLFSINPDTIEQQIHLLGGTPVIIKLLEGTQGLGVILAETDKSAKSIIDTFYKMDADILMQEYIEEANGEDIRIFVVGQKIIASMKRKSVKDDFRSNVHRGGITEKVKLSPKEENMALLAVKQLGLGVAGVDLIRSKKGPLLIEVNASPGLQGIEAASGVNVAKEIILYIENNGHKRRK